MAWTYDPTQFNDATAGTYTGSTKGIRWQVRLYIFDTNTNRQLFQDEEIDWIQTTEMNAFTMGAALCDMLVAKAGGIRRKRISDFDISYDVEFYRSLAATLRARGAGHQVPYAGGISVSDKLAQQSNPDWVSPAIPRGLDNNPAAPGPASPPIDPNGSPLTSI